MRNSIWKEETDWYLTKNVSTQSRGSRFNDFANSIMYWAIIAWCLDNDLIVTLPLNKNLPWYAAYSAVATGPLVGAGVFLAQKVFKKQIDELTSLKYEVSGTFSEPNVQFLSMFDSSLRKSADPAAVTESPEPDADAARE